MNANYDLVIVGGGVGGAALAGSIASAGARVLVLEAESRFRDRVRGEAIMPWGVAEVKLLGLEHTLIQAAANPLPFWDSYAGADRSGRRDLRRTTSVEEPALACYHPKLQESLLRWAEGCGAEVRRGVRVTGLDTSGSSPTLSAGTGGEISGRLIVGADGRGSTVRAVAGFQTCQDAGQNLVSGVLMERVALAEDATHAWLDTSKGHFILHFPQGRERFRVYLCYPAASGRRFSGEADVPAVLDQCVASGVPQETYAHAEPAGPLATFDGRSTWADTAYQNGVVLVGDAAANSDPTWGQGLSVALRDARVLRDRLLADEDWGTAGRAYAEERKGYFDVVHTMELWQNRLLMTAGPESDAARRQAFGKWREDRTRNPDTFLSGPGAPLDDIAHRRFFGED